MSEKLIALRLNKMRKIEYHAAATLLIVLEMGSVVKLSGKTDFHFYLIMIRISDAQESKCKRSTDLKKENLGHYFW